MSEKKNEVTTVLQNEKEQSLQSFILTQLDKFFIEHIPISTFKEMDPICKIISFSLIISFMNLEINISFAIDMYVFGGLAYFLFGGLFVYFTVESYYSNYKQAFISLNSNAGSCSTVPITISNSYLAGLYSAFFFHLIFTFLLHYYHQHCRLERKLDRDGTIQLLLGIVFAVFEWVLHHQQFTIQ